MPVSRFAAIICAILMTLATPVLADHPGANLDKVMGDKEKFFQAIDQPAPGFGLVNANGEQVRLSDFADKIVVLNFIFVGCLGVCPLHSEKIAKIQGLLNASPMRDLVQFITVTTDPDRDTAKVMRSYGETHGFDPVNWMFLTKQPVQNGTATRVLARDYGLEFTEIDGGQQMHGVVTHIIDRDGRFAAKFHGLRFESVNMILYINGLINNAYAPKPSAKKGWWERLTDWF